MKDRFGRPLKSIRISVTKRCNLSCFYCHREGEVSGGEFLRPEDFHTIGEASSRAGIKKAKLTGGEPLLREDLEEIVSVLSKYMEEVSLTTNGVGLDERADALKEAGLKRVNISLDTLQPERYRRITGRDLLESVISGVKASVRAGLRPVKLNMVLLRGINTDEVWEMSRFAMEVGAILQVIEVEAPRGEEFYSAYHTDPAPLERELKRKALKVIKRELHARRQYVVPLDGGEATVEVVRPMHNTSFCMGCTRIRLTSDGFLKPCLFRNDNLVDVRDALKDPEEFYRRILLANERREPYWR